MPTVEEKILWKCHDFGARGVSSAESAGIGGAAHLVNFLGTDTIEALLFARRHYDADMAGFSVPAMEHSTTTSWGRECEVDAYRNMVKKNGKLGGIVSVVSDSYDIFNACKLWGTELKQDVLDSGATLVVRPDSGDPATVVLKCLQILDKYFGHTVNEKGFKVLNNVRVLQGDGININSVKEILDTLIGDGYSADSVVFGMGGALLQHVNRDSQKFAMKCSTAMINGEWVPVFKDPITDPGKRSKRGHLKLINSPDGGISTVSAFEDLQQYAYCDDLMRVVFRNGFLMVRDSLGQIRERAVISF